MLSINSFCTIFYLKYLQILRDEREISLIGFGVHLVLHPLSPGPFGLGCIYHYQHLQKYITSTEICKWFVNLKDWNGFSTCLSNIHWNLPFEMEIGWNRFISLWIRKWDFSMCFSYSTWQLAYDPGFLCQQVFWQTIT